MLLGLQSPDGEEGYPGNVEATVELTVKPEALAITLSARTDAATPINLTYHPYFNLAGDFSVPATDQWLRIPAGHYLPVAAGLIPTGEIAPVDATFDFRSRRRLKPPPTGTHAQLGSPADMTIAGCSTLTRIAPASSRRRIGISR